LRSQIVRLVDSEMKLNKQLQQLWRDESGQDLTEYGLLLVLVSLAATAAMGSLATAISTAFGTAAANVPGS
jgi:Flp pilus assembly pilin Flp